MCRKGSQEGVEGVRDIGVKNTVLEGVKKAYKGPY
jgi:hypothetical protein